MDDAMYETFTHYCDLAGQLPQGDDRLQFRTCSIVVSRDLFEQAFVISAPTGEHLSTVLKLAEMAPRIAAAIEAVKAENERLRAALAATNAPAPTTAPGA